MIFKRSKIEVAKAKQWNLSPFIVADKLSKQRKKLGKWQRRRKENSNNITSLLKLLGYKLYKINTCWTKKDQLTQIYNI